MLRKEEKEEWVEDSRKANHRLFSELDVLLRALDRFFNIDNLTSSSDDLTNKNFYEELVTIRDTILRVLGVLEVVIPENKKNTYWFQKFAESKLLSSRGRDDFRERLYRQDTREKSLYLLYDSVINLKGVISGLFRTGTIYMGLMNIGHMIGKEIRENIYFNPFRKGLNAEFDTITNPKISDIVRSIGQKEVRKYLSVIYVYLFRFIRSMGFIGVETQRPISLNVSLIILILLRSEIGVFQGYLEKAVKKISDPELQDRLKSISCQFSTGIRRVYLQELRDIRRKKGSPHFRGKIENCHGILKNLIEQTVVQLSQHVSSDIGGEEIFVSFLTKLQQSIRLREDIMVLHGFIMKIVEKADDASERLKVFESMRSYMLYFESFTFRMLRHDDYEEFVMFFNDIHSARRDVIMVPGSRNCWT